MKKAATKKGHFVPHSLESKLLMSKNRIGKAKGVKNSMWRGDNVGYLGLHSWVNRNFPTPAQCEECKTFDSKRFHWHADEYTRERKDWRYLCARCHSIIHAHNNMWVNYIKPICRVCGKESLAKGLCALHYQHQYRGVANYV